MIVMIGIASVLVLGSFGIRSFNSNETESTAKVVKLKRAKSNFVAINLEQQDGTYAETTEVPRGGVLFKHK